MCSQKVVTNMVTLDWLEVMSDDNLWQDKFLQTTENYVITIQEMSQVVKVEVPAGSQKLPLLVAFLFL